MDVQFTSPLYMGYFKKFVIRNLNDGSYFNVEKDLFTKKKSDATKLTKNQLFWNLKALRNAGYKVTFNGTK